MMPTGHDTETAQALYNYLYSQYFQQIPVDRTQILWSGPFWIAFWAFLLTLFFFLYSRYLQSVHRKKGEMYGAASFAGSILERIGEVSVFSWFVTAMLVGVAVYFIVTQILNGFIY